MSSKDTPGSSSNGSTLATELTPQDRPDYRRKLRKQAALRLQEMLRNHSESHRARIHETSDEHERALLLEISQTALILSHVVDFLHEDY